MAKVRAVESGDISRIVEIAAESTTAAQWNPKEYENLVSGLQDFDESRANRIALVMEENNAVCGFMVAHEIGDEWEIENIAVAQQMQHRGLGALLLSEFLELVQREKSQRIFLEVRESNVAARALYRKKGFEEAGWRKNYYDNPSEDALILRFIFSI